MIKILDSLENYDKISVKEMVVNESLGYSMLRVFVCGEAFEGEKVLVG